MKIVLRTGEVYHTHLIQCTAIGNIIFTTIEGDNYGIHISSVETIVSE